MSKLLEQIEALRNMYGYAAAIKETCELIRKHAQQPTQESGSRWGGYEVVDEGDNYVYLRKPAP